MRKAFALTALAGVALTSEVVGDFDDNFAAWTEFPRIQRHPLYLDADVSGGDASELNHQRELIRSQFPIFNKKFENFDDDEMFTALPGEMEFKDRKPTLSIFDKKKVEHERGHGDHEMVFLSEYIKTPVFQTFPTFNDVRTRTPVSKPQTQEEEEEELKKVVKRSNYSIFDKREAVPKQGNLRPVKEEPQKNLNNGRTHYTNFTRKEARSQEVEEELAVLYLKWLIEEGLEIDNDLYGIRDPFKKGKDSKKGDILSLDDAEDNDLYGIRNPFKKDKDSKKGDILSLDDGDNELFNLNGSQLDLVNYINISKGQKKPAPVDSIPPKSHKKLLDEATRVVREVQDRNQKNRKPTLFI